MQSVSAYKANDTHYFKLRDLAAAMTGSSKAFDLAWDDVQQRISILPGRAYTPPENADTEPLQDFSQALFAPAQVVFGTEVHTLDAYLIQDHYYFKLRDVLQLLDTGVFWNGRRELVEIDTSYPYLPWDYSFPAHQNVIVLMYHDFTTAAVPAGKEAVTTTAAKFEMDLRTLLSAGWKPLTLEALYLGKADPAERYFIVTCDDGYLSNYTVAFPILQRLQIPMDIFINTDNTGLSHHFDLEQAAEMEASGLVRIYSHFPQHTVLTGLDTAQLSQELARSLDTLESALEPKHINFFAYPYGAYDDATYAAVQAAGFALQLVQKGDGVSPQLVVRINVSYDSDILELAAAAPLN